MNKNNSKESIHQEFERFMRDEMDDIERERYVKSDRYEKIIKTFEIILKEKKNK